MQNGTDMQISYRENGQVARLELPTDFVFSAHVAFREALKNIRASAPVQTLELDFSRVMQLDSAALGMLRCLIYDEPRYTVRLLHARADVRDMLEMAQLNPA